MYKFSKAEYKRNKMHEQQPEAKDHTHEKNSNKQISKHHTANSRNYISHTWDISVGADNAKLRMRASLSVCRSVVFHSSQSNKDSRQTGHQLWVAHSRIAILNCIELRVCVCVCEWFCEIPIRQSRFNVQRIMLDSKRDKQKPTQTERLEFELWLWHSAMNAVLKVFAALINGWHSVNAGPNNTRSAHNNIFNCTPNDTIWAIGERRRKKTGVIKIEVRIGHIFLYLSLCVCLSLIRSISCLRAQWPLCNEVSELCTWSFEIEFSIYFIGLDVFKTKKYSYFAHATQIWLTRWCKTKLLLKYRRLAAWSPLPPPPSPPPMTTYLINGCVQCP